MYERNYLKAPQERRRAGSNGGMLGLSIRKGRVEATIGKRAQRHGSADDGTGVGKKLWPSLEGFEGPSGVEIPDRVENDVWKGEWKIRGRKR